MTFNKIITTIFLTLVFFYDLSGQSTFNVIREKAPVDDTRSTGFIDRESINKPDIYGNTRLHNAARVGDWKLVEELLNQGADPNAVNCGNATPLALELHWQIMDSAGNVKKNHLKSMETLLAAGTDPFIEDIAGSSFDDFVTGYVSDRCEHAQRDCKGWQEVADLLDKYR